MVRQQELSALVERLGDGGGHGIDGEQDSVDTFGWVAADQPHGVPRLSPAGVEPPVEDGYQIGDPSHEMRRYRAHWPHSRLECGTLVLRPKAKEASDHGAVRRIRGLVVPRL